MQLLVKAFEMYGSQLLYFLNFVTKMPDGNFELKSVSSKQEKYIFFDSVFEIKVSQHSNYKFPVNVDGT